MDKILDREVAWRIFAWEFNRSTLHMIEGDERAPNYIITPTGVKCNRLFIVGVATEVENIGKDNSLWRGRVADPTGVFTVYAGHYQPEAAIFLSELNIPAYVAVVGKARTFEPEDGSVYTSVRPEEMNNADEKLRDRWVLDTAERTLERIGYIEDALSSGKSGNDLKEYLIGKGINNVLADGAVKSVEHYKNLDKTMAELKSAVFHAIGTIASEVKKQPVESQKKQQMKVPGVAPLDGTSTYAAAGAYVSMHCSEHADELRCNESPSEKQKEPQIEKQDIIEKNMEKPYEDIASPELDDVVIKEETEPKETKTGPLEIIAGIIDQLDTGKGISYSIVVEAAQNVGIDPENVESSIKELMDEGRCYEPKIGVLRKV